MRALLLLPLIGACAPVVTGSVDIVNALQISLPSCIPSPDVPLEEAPLFDIGGSTATANVLSAAFDVVTELQRDGEVIARALSITEARSYVTIDGSGDALTDATPHSDDSARAVGPLGAIVNEVGAPAFVFASVVPMEDAAALQQEPAIVEALASTGRARVELNVRMVASGEAQTVVSDVFVMPIDLCRGCLVPECAPGESIVPATEDGACMRGVDVPFVCLAP